MKVNGYCVSCGTAYTVNLPDTPGSYTVRCPRCSGLNTATVAVTTSGVAPAPTPVKTAEQVVRRIWTLELISCICWILIGAVQVYFLYTAAAGVWNIVNAIIGLVNLRNIKVGNTQVVPFYDQKKTMLIIFAVVNLVLGGVVGVLLVLLEWYIRDYVLKNRWAFGG